VATERLMGIENEFAFTAINRAGGIAERQCAIESTDEIAERLFVSLPCFSGSGIFLENGARLYLDCGAHLEYCTPECTQPWDVVRYLRAGERMMVQLAQELAKKKRFRSATFYRCNVAYSGAGSTWGTHESYLHRADLKHLPDEMIPFFVSRLIITGAGGFNPLSPAGCIPTLSPRVHHINTPVSNDSTRDRGIYHTKCESLGGYGYHRLHVLVGECLCSDTGNWLKIAITALAVAMAEAGLNPGRDVALAAPVEAMRAFAGDFTGKRATASTAGGGSVTAIDIQRHYLTLAQMNVHASWMPAWAPTAIEYWDSILRRIEEGGPDAVATCLDWAIKRQVFAAHLRKRDFTWEKLEQWTHLAGLLGNGLSSLRPPMPPSTLSTAFLNNRHGPLAAMIEQLHPYLAARQLDWNELDAYFKIRQELFEIDTRFGELGGGGIFDRLDAAGALDHRISGVDNIEHAMTNPPAGGRAHLRGMLIRQLAPRRNEFGCDWDSVQEFTSDRELDLSDPFGEEADWIDHPKPQERTLYLQRFLSMREARQRLRAANSGQ